MWVMLMTLYNFFSCNYFYICICYFLFYYIMNSVSLILQHVCGTLLLLLLLVFLLYINYISSYFHSAYHSYNFTYMTHLYFKYKPKKKNINDQQCLMWFYLSYYNQSLPIRLILVSIAVMSFYHVFDMTEVLSQMTNYTISIYKFLC